MAATVIKQCKFSELEQDENFPALVAEYGLESAIEGLGPPTAQTDMYLKMEEVGALHVMAAFTGNHQLVGFMILIVSVLPHYGTTIGSTESFFVAGSARKGGAGLKLLRAAEKLVQSLGAIGLFVSAPVASRLEQVLPAVGYRETNRVFFRGLQ